MDTMKHERHSPLRLLCFTSHSDVTAAIPPKPGRANSDRSTNEPRSRQGCEETLTQRSVRVRHERVINVARHTVSDIDGFPS